MMARTFPEKINKNPRLPNGEIDTLNEHASETAPDDVPNLTARREAAREHSDAYIVDADLEDADQREASPGTREQS